MRRLRSAVLAPPLVALALLGLPAQAGAVHQPGGFGGGTGPTTEAKETGKKAGKGPAKTAEEKREEKEEKGEEGQLTEVPEGAKPSTLAEELGSQGQVDPISGLGLSNPVCEQPGEIRNVETRTSCETDGTPESLYPVSNYGFDVFIPTGVTHPVGDIMAGLTTAMNGVWLGLLFVLKLVLTLLGLAFGLNPFSNGPTMAKISEGLGRIYSTVSDPWLSALVVCGGVWLAYKGLLKRDVSASVAGTVLAVAMLVVGLWVIDRPRETVGELATLSNEVALGVISAPQSGGVSHPLGTYAESMSRIWNEMVEVPFAGLDFSDVKWALGPPPEEAVKKANEKFCDDNGALDLLSTLQNLGLGHAEEECGKFAEERYGKPKKVIDLYLRSSPNSAARSELWNYFDNDDQYKPKVAAQGGDGVMTRLSMLALFAIGLAGALCLLAWLAIRLFTQAAIAFVLLLAAPFALFFPLLGDAGRRAFKEWGLTLFGAVVAKVIYAAFLSVVMLGITVLGTSLAGGGAMGFLISSAFCWAVFLKRSEFVGFMTIDPQASGHEAGFGLGFGLGTVGRLGGRVAGAPLRVAGGIGHGLGRRTGRLVAHRMRVGAAGTREGARGGLADGARALADQRYDEAQEKIKAFEGSSGGSKGKGGRGGEMPSEPAGGGGEEPTEPVGGGSREPKTGGGPREPEPRTSGQAGEGEGTGGGGPKPHSGGEPNKGGEGPKEGSEGPSGKPARKVSKGEYRRAQSLVSQADDREERLGDRWSAGDLYRIGEEDRHLLRDRSRPVDHAHRAGYGREEFEALRGEDREKAIAKIDAARKRDQRRLRLDENPPGIVVGRPRQAIERWKQGFMSPERREALREVRRKSRTERVSRHRRNLSRGR